MRLALCPLIALDELNEEGVVHSEMVVSAPSLLVYEHEFVSGGRQGLKKGSHATIALGYQALGLGLSIELGHGLFQGCSALLRLVFSKFAD